MRLASFAVPAVRSRDRGSDADRPRSRRGSDADYPRAAPPRLRRGSSPGRGAAAAPARTVREGVRARAPRTRPLEERKETRALRTDEEAAAEVHGHVEVMIQEARILRGVQQLQQRGRGVARRAAASQLVDFVNQHDGVEALRGLEALDRLAGHRADVPEARARVATDVNARPVAAEMIRVARPRLRLRG